MTEVSPTPFRFQLQAARQLHRFGGRMLLADEMGLGKSLSALLYAHQRDLFPMLVVCPATLNWNWAKEAGTHFGTRAIVLEGGTPNRHLLEGKRTPITILNYDRLISRRRAGKGWLRWLLEVGYKFLVLDEGHYLASRSSKRTLACRELCESIEKVCVLTGTPFTSEPAQLWPMLNMLRPDIWHSWSEFAWAHCDPRRNRFSGGWEFKGATNMDRLHTRLVENVMLRRTKAEVLSEMPAITRCVLPLPIANESEYRKAEDHFLEWLRGSEHKDRVRTAMRAEALVKVNYLKQLAAKLKLPAVMKWIDDFLVGGKKLVVFCTHRKVLADLSSRWRGKCVVVQGDTTTQARQHAVDRFQRDNTCRLFFGNLKAAGVGVTLTAASDVAFVEYGWVPGDHLQGEKRCDRISQKEPVTAWWLVGRGTVESRIVELLQTKQMAFGQAIDGTDDNELDVFDQLCEALT